MYKVGTNENGSRYRRNNVIEGIYQLQWDPPLPLYGGVYLCRRNRQRLVIEQSADGKLATYLQHASRPLTESVVIKIGYGGDVYLYPLLENYSLEACDAWLEYRLEIVRDGPRVKTLRGTARSQAGTTIMNYERDDTLTRP